MNSKISVIIPVYNTFKYLKECVNSVLSNTYENYEVLLIDDGSTDGSSEICDYFEKENAKVRVFHTPNNGLCAARNLGLDNATGDFIYFVDSDDTVAKEALERALSEMRDDVEIVMFGFRRVIERENFRPDTCMNHAVGKELDRTGAFECIIYGAGGPYVWNKLYRKTVIEEHNLRFRSDGQGAEDMFFNTEYLLYCDKAVILNEKLYFYFDNGGSIMSTFRNSKRVSATYMSLPRSWRYAADAVKDMRGDLYDNSRARATMLYQTVLRKIQSPDKEFVQEAREYVGGNLNSLLKFKWGFKYWLSGVMFNIAYPIWYKIVR